jgi:hypothetical protein
MSTVESLLSSKELTLGDRPILTPKTVLPLFFIVGIIFAPIGGLLLYASAQVQELSIDYTECIYNAPNTTADVDTAEALAEVPSSKVSSAFKSATTEQPKWGRATQKFTWPSKEEEDANVCILTFNVPNDVKPPILFYYRLTNFYQNHRRYVKSLDTAQLKGDARDPGAIRSGDCDPLDVDANNRPYYPCGLIANSMFNDTYMNLTYLNPQGGDSAAPGGTNYTFSQKGIAWSTEKDLYGVSKYKPEEVVPPPNWAKQYPADGYNKTGLPDLHTMEDFQVWMRTAGLPTFSKLAMKNNDEVMKSGTYRLKIYDSESREGDAVTES